MEEPAEDILRFIADRIDTVPQIEALLLLWEARPRAFTVGELAKRIFVTEETALQVLKDLQRKRFVAASEDASQYSYDSRWDAAGDLIERVSVTYRRHLIRVTALIHSKAPAAVREFARAFEPKKER